MRGSRVQAVVQELRGERIDIVPWSPDPARYVCSALAPAQISKVIIDDANQSMDVIVADDQLSLAIGRRGQNVRLAVQLTGWSIDIKSESKMREVARWLSEAIAEVEGCGDPEAEILLQQGILSLEDLSECQSELLMQLPGIDEAGAQNVKAKALALIGRRDTEEQERVVAEAEAVAQAAIIAATPVAEEVASEETAEAVAPSEEPSETAEENADEDSSEPTNG
jgi:N utilization substance protein A